MRLSPSTPSSEQNSNTTLLLFIAFVTFWFALLKIPLEMEILSRAAPPHLSIHDFYNHKAKHFSTVEQRIDAKQSYHFFDRRGPHHSEQETKEDEELAHEVERMVHHYYKQHENEHEEHRHLRSGKLGNPHESKEEDPFANDISQEVQGIVDHYHHDPDEI
ncbi:expressed unknown protein [Seminavis robusta]|uniref:Uncharacterized protein n=1 Tax=Seminavis robusta TaxID=568900 RepID=A0A9N8HVT0_9STRA|nr:expressed unknown protein [Seminavis robusta]|eukprot:Sro2000_g310240.1 n/a (161) ;mRNA; f:11033-11515